MTREEALDKVASILEEVVGVDRAEVVEGAEFRDRLDVDSLAMVEVVVSAEMQFGIRIRDEEMGSIHTVRDLVDRAVAG